MKKFLQTLMLVAAMCLPWAMNAQSVLTVADGTTTNDYVPFYGFYMDDNQHTQILYEDALLTELRGSYITQMTFYCSTTGAYNYTSSVTISLGITDAADLSSGFVATPASEVYSGTVSRANQQVVVVFDEPFIYPATGGNLLFDFASLAGNYNSCSFYGVTATGMSVNQYGSRSADQKNFIPKTTFTYEEIATCPKPGNLQVEAVTSTSLDIAWTPRGEETSWEVFVTRDADATPTTATATVNTPAYSATNLLTDSTYYFYVRAYCAADDQSSWIGPLAMAPTCPAPAGVSYSNLSRNSVNFTFTPSQFSTGSYLVSYCVVGSTDTIDVNVDTTFVTIDGLEPATDYFFALHGACGTEASSRWFYAMLHTLDIPLSTYPYSCDFSVPAENRNWNVRNNANGWYIDTNLYVSDDNGITNSYDPGAASYSWAFRTLSLPAGSYNIEFDWRAVGESGYDYLRAFLAPADAAIYAGRTTWTGFIPLSDALVDSEEWQHQVASRIEIEHDTVLQLAFLWMNDGSYGVNPPAAIDNITVTPFDCSYVKSLEVANATPGSALIAVEVFSIENEDFAGVTVECVAAGAEPQVATLTGSGYVTFTGLEADVPYTISAYTTCGTTNTDTIRTALITPSLPCIDFDTVINVTIGEGTSTNNYLPSYSYYDYGLSEQIYLASEVGAAGPITSLTFEMTAVNQARGPWRIYLGHTSQSSMTSMFIPDDTTLVFAGDQGLTVGMNTFNFTTPFNYNGTDNLVVIFFDDCGSYQSGNFSRVHSASNMARYLYRDNYSYTTSDITGGSAASYRMNMTFQGGSCQEYGACTQPLLATTNVSNTSIDLVWAAGYRDSAWKVETKLATDSVWTVAFDSTTLTSHSFTGLDEHTVYNFRVTAYCGDNDYATELTVKTLHCLDSVVFNPLNSTSTSYYYPVNNNYYYSYSQSRYKASEMGGERLITAIGYEYYSNASAMTAKDTVEIYFSHATTNAGTGRVNLDSTAVLVYSGALNCAPGWNVFDFNQVEAFAYNGAQDLLVTVIDHSGAKDGSSYYFRSSNPGFYGATYYGYNNTFAPEANDLTSYRGTNSNSSYRPSTQFYSCGTDYCGQVYAALDTVIRDTAWFDWGGHGTDFRVVVTEAHHGDSILVDTLFHFNSVRVDTVYGLKLIGLPYSLEAGADPAFPDGYITDFTASFYQICDSDTANYTESDPYEIHFSTPIPCTRPGRVYVIQNGYKSALVGWMTGNNANTYDFELQYAPMSEITSQGYILGDELDNVETINWRAIDATDGLTASNVWFLDNVLEPATEYAFRVRQVCDFAQDIASFWVYSEFTTLDCEPLDSIKIADTNYTSATLNIFDGQNVIADEFYNGEYRMYLYETNTWDLVESQTLTTNTYAFEGLEPATTYLVEVVKVCDPERSVDAGWSYAYFTTTSCDNVTLAPVDTLSFTTAKVEWTDANNINNYELRYSFLTDSLVPVVNSYEVIDTVEATETRYREISELRDTVYNVTRCDTTWYSDGSYDLENCREVTRHTTYTYTYTEEYTIDTVYYPVRTVYDTTDRTEQYRDTILIQGINAKAYELVGLSQNTPYIVEVRSLCDPEHGIYSEWMAESFITLQCEAVSAITPFHVNKYTASVRIDGTAAQYDVQYRQQGEEWPTTFETVDSILNLADLTAGTTYEVRARQYCSFDEENELRVVTDDWSDPVMFTTATCEPITGLRSFQQGFTSANIMWNERRAKTDIRYWIEGDEENFEERTITNSNFYTLSPLEVGANYKVTVLGYCDVTDPLNIIVSDDWTEPIDIYTNGCRTVETFTAHNVDYDTVVLSWSGIDGDDSIRYRANGTEAWTAVRVAGDTTLTLTGLQHGTTYTAQVGHICLDPVSELFSGYSNSVTFTTVLCEPVVIEQPLPFFDTIHFAWSSTAAGSYEYKLVRFDTNTVGENTMVEPVLLGQDVTTDTVMDFFGLNANSDYMFVVRALCTDLSNSVWDTVYTHTLECYVPRNLAVSNIRYLSADITWDANFGTTTLAWRGINGTDTNDWHVVSGIEGNSYTITPLYWNSGTELLVSGDYVFEVFTQHACNFQAGDVWTEFSDTISFSTLPGESMPAVAAEMDYTTATLTWDEEAVSHEYFIYVNGYEYGSTTDNSFVVEDLVPGAQYEFTVGRYLDYYPWNGYIYGFIWSDNTVIATTTMCADVENIHVEDITTTTANLVFDGTSPYYEIMWRNANSSNWNAPFVQDSTTFAFTDLIPNNSYYVKVRSFCDAGKLYPNAWSETVLFTTLATCDPATNVNVNNVTATGAVVAWVETGNFEVAYRVAETEAWDTISVENNNNYTFTELTAATAYELMVRRVCGENYTSNWSDILSFNTTCVELTDLAVSNVSYTGATVTWTVANANELRYRVAGTNDWTNVDSATSPYLFSNLEMGTSYEVQVRLNCAENIFSDWATVTFATPACGTISNVTAYNVSVNTAELMWNGTSERYTITMGENTYNVEGTHLLLSDLTASTEYTVTVSNDCGNSAQVTFTTQNVPCPAITDVNASNVSYTSATLTWNGNSDSYTVSVNGTEQTVTSTTLALTGLTTGTAYTVVVSNACGNSASTSFTTLSCGTPSILAVNAGINDATVMWMGSANSYEVQLDNENPVTVSSNSYTFTGLTAETSYQVRVRAICAEGIYSDWSAATAFSTEQVPCPAVSNVMAINVTHNSATLFWNGTSESYNVNVNGTDYTATTTTLALSGLEANTAYTVVVSNACGNSASTSFTTEEVPCPAVSNVVASNVTYTSATLTWNGSSESYTVSVNGTDYTAETNSYELTGLTTGTTYNVVVSNACGNSASTSFTTLSCEAPVILGVTNVTENSAYVMWMGTANGYTVEYRQSGTSSWNHADVTGNGYQITGLSASTAYEVRVTAVCADGITSESSQVMTFTTAQHVGIDDVEGQLSVTIFPNPASTTATVSYTGFVGQVEILIVDMTGRVVARENTTCDGNCEHQLEVNGLAAGNYFVRINGESASQVKKLIVK